MVPPRRRPGGPGLRKCTPGPRRPTAELRARAAFGQGRAGPARSIWPPGQRGCLPEAPSAAERSPRARAGIRRRHPSRRRRRLGPRRIRPARRRRGRSERARWTAGFSGSTTAAVCRYEKCGGMISGLRRAPSRGTRRRDGAVTRGWEGDVTRDLGRDPSAVERCATRTHGAVQRGRGSLRGRRFDAGGNRRAAWGTVRATVRCGLAARETVRYVIRCVGT